MARLGTIGGGTAILLGLLLVSGCGKSQTTKSEQPSPSKSAQSGPAKPEQPAAAQPEEAAVAPVKGNNPDEAQRAGRDADTLKQADEDYFHDMDNGAYNHVPLTPDEIKGRNMWLVWSGNDRIWDKFIASSAGVFDPLKIVTSHPSQTYCDGPCGRDSRWRWLGAINEPCFDKPTAPDPERFNLWLDVRRKDEDCPPDPFENEEKYPGVKIGARGEPIGGGKILPVGSYYGYGTGILGLRLFPNPDFNEEAAKNWDPERYYTDPNYYNDPKLVRPYRIGMACGFCHVGPSPIHPPADPANPKFSELNSTVGAQYLWMDRFFAYASDRKNFLFQLLHSYPPGTFDTSLESTDYIDNPRTMNAVYNLAARLAIAKRWGKERLKGGELDNMQLDGTFTPPDTSWSPRVLKDGADSVGILGALNRVYVNIGVYSEDWLTHFNPFFGGKPITPFLISNAEENSAYWRATEVGSKDMAAFLVKAGQPDRLEDAPGGKAYLSNDQTLLKRGKIIFAETCARCHSGKLPDIAWKALDPGGCSGPNYLECFKGYWKLTKTSDFKAKMREIVLAPDFLKDNYLSTDARIPVTLLRTNACSPLGTNAIRNNIWDNFSSSTYKSLPSVGEITVQDPFTGERWHYQMPGGGLGFTRVPSLVSVWSSAPFFVNNRLGPFDQNPSVESRMNSFAASIEQLLWPEKRVAEPGLDGFVVRTAERSSVSIPKRDIPVELENIFGSPQEPLPGLLPEPFRGLLKNQITNLFDKDGNFVLGPIPKGFPINLAANYQPQADIQGPAGTLEHAKNFTALLAAIVKNLPLPGADASDEEWLGWLKNLREPWIKLLKCPDFVVNKGHYFGTKQFNNTQGLSDDEKSFVKEPEPVLSDKDKKALIEFIKTF
jgi:hypothetical protein